MNALKLLILVLFPFCYALNAQNIHPKLDSVLRKKLSDQHLSLNVKGLSAAIQFADGRVWAGSVGTSTPFEPVDTAMAFGIASITKTITSACILQMADDSLLRLDDKLSQWLDTFQYINPDITIRQLLRHQSGIFDVLYDPDFQTVMLQSPDSIWALADVVKTFIGPPVFQPGTQFQYSNTNYILLGMIAEAAGGKPYYESCRERFFEPLGLSSFRLSPFEQTHHSTAHIWADLNGDGAVDDAHNLFSNWHSFDAATAPAGSYYATASDLARWIRAFGSGALHSAEIMTQAKATVPTTFPGGTKYGLGLMQRSFLGHTSYGHGGDFGFSGSAWYFPGKGISIAVLNNDARKTSWQLAPVVQALLAGYLDCESLVGTDETGTTMDLTLTPNPFLDVIALRSEQFKNVQQVDWSISDASGKIVARGNVPVGEGDNVQINGLGHLPAGIYVLQCSAEGQFDLSRKVLKS